MTPRMRIFAGPNGSGKSTLAAWLSTDYAVNLYHFINADALFAEISCSFRTACPFSTDNDALLSFVSRTTFPDLQKAFFSSGQIHIENDIVVFEREAVNSYTAAMLADFYRSEYIARKESFSFETVFSHPSKIETIKTAQANGFRTYLYFVATENPKINISRVYSRVKQGGHDVPVDKIVERFHRCLDNVGGALPCLNRAYFFDNSDNGIRFVAEMNEGHWTFYTRTLPRWFLSSISTHIES